MMYVRQADEGDLVVVLVKGLFCTWGIFIPQDHLESQKPNLKSSGPVRSNYLTPNYSRDLPSLWSATSHHHHQDQLMGLSSPSAQAVSTWHQHNLDTLETNVHSISTVWKVIEGSGFKVPWNSYQRSCPSSRHHNSEQWQGSCWK